MTESELKKLSKAKKKQMMSEDVMHEKCKQACNMLSKELKQTIKTVKTRVGEDRLPLLSLMVPEPELEMQSSHLSFQEFYTARAIANVDAAHRKRWCDPSQTLMRPILPQKASKPWLWPSWWANVLRFGEELGVEFGR